ncbi:hypothetical protein Pan44_40800 [Caulifigura coniformis]|uniref:Uncharacterized protein n=1 Tax=Caulifigura coniformis TaxID=2527983 RepID=A0A517SIT5_9PLAN|nr:hypothetical protein [Caulifigura coniformis]QDT56030.1 hypothetical protein Pan44_40800 [Caulifigura coniformis]
MFRTDSLRTLVLAGALCMAFAGCGEGKFPVRPATGKVLCSGRPVGIGSISFTPVGDPGSMESGKPAMGTLRPDGTFTLTTNDRFDGAIVGKHSVRYFGPEDEDSDEPSVAEGSAEEKAKIAERQKQKKEQQKMLCVQKGEIIVEVKNDGVNDFTIELTSGGPG